VKTDSCYPGPPAQTRGDALGNAEAETHDANRRSESARELPAYIRDHVDLPEDIVSKIEAVLRE
jgi:hypothetical protein